MTQMGEEPKALFTKDGYLVSGFRTILRDQGKGIQWYRLTLKQAQ